MARRPLEEALLTALARVADEHGCFCLSKREMAELSGQMRSGRADTSGINMVVARLIREGRLIREFRHDANGLMLANSYRLASIK